MKSVKWEEGRGKREEGRGKRKRGGMAKLRSFKACAH